MGSPVAKLTGCPTAASTWSPSLTITIAQLLIAHIVQLVDQAWVGTLSYQGRTPVSMIANVLRGGAVPSSDREARISQAVSNVVMPLLARDQTDRVPSAIVLRQRLADVAD